MSVVKCFVVGCSRSGTTLASVLLDRHSQLAMTPETAFYRDLAAHFSKMNTDRLTDILGSWRRLPELGLDAEGVVRACGGQFSRGQVFEAMLTLFARARGKPYCGEKTPGHWRHRCITAILEDFPHAIILFMMRDGRDTALSLRSMPFFTHGLEAAARLWIEAARTCRELTESDPGRVIVVRYERLVKDPRAVLAQIMGSLDLRFEEAQLDLAINSGVVLERSRPWKGRALEAIDADRIGSWRQAATTDEADYLQQIMGPELSYFGYHET